MGIGIAFFREWQGADQVLARTLIVAIFIVSMSASVHAEKQSSIVRCFKALLGPSFKLAPSSTPAELSDNELWLVTGKLSVDQLRSQVSNKRADDRLRAFSYLRLAESELHSDFIRGHNFVRLGSQLHNQSWFFWEKAGDAFVSVQDESGGMTASARRSAIESYMNALDVYDDAAMLEADDARIRLKMHRLENDEGQRLFLNDFFAKVDVLSIAAAGAVSSPSSWEDASQVDLDKLERQVSDKISMIDQSLELMNALSEDELRQELLKRTEIEDYDSVYSKAMEPLQHWIPQVLSDLQKLAGSKRSVEVVRQYDRLALSLLKMPKVRDPSELEIAEQFQSESTQSIWRFFFDSSEQIASEIRNDSQARENLMNHEFRSPHDSLGWGGLYLLGRVHEEPETSAALGDRSKELIQTLSASWSVSGDQIQTVLSEIETRVRR